jgi:hypothetical protein
MLAIFRVSRGLNGLGDLEVLLFPERGVPEVVENCSHHQPTSAHSRARTYVILCFHEIVAEIVVLVFLNQNTVPEVVKRSVGGAGKYRTIQSEHTSRNLYMSVLRDVVTTQVSSPISVLPRYR